MKNFSTVLGFELRNYFKNKSFMIWTLLIGILAIGAMFLPRFVNLFGAEGESAEIRQMAARSRGQQSIGWMRPVLWMRKCACTIICSWMPIRMPRIKISWIPLTRNH